MERFIPEEILKSFQNKYETGDVWQVHTGHTWLAIFLYSNDQIEKNKSLPVYEQMRKEYFDLTVKYLDITPNRPHSITVYFDSKENFETKYRGSGLFYYT